MLATAIPTKTTTRQKKIVPTNYNIINHDNTNNVPNISYGVEETHINLNQDPQVLIYSIQMDALPEILQNV